MQIWAAMKLPICLYFIYVLLRYIMLLIYMLSWNTGTCITVDLELPLWASNLTVIQTADITNRCCQLQCTHVIRMYKHTVSHFHKHVEGRVCLDSLEHVSTEHCHMFKLVRARTLFGSDALCNWAHMPQVFEVWTNKTFLASFTSNSIPLLRHLAQTQSSWRMHQRRVHLWN